MFSCWEKARVLTYDAIPWLMAQDGQAAVRASRLVSLHRDGD